MMHPLITGIGTALIIAILPGPVFFALIQSSIQKGVRFAGLFALGVAVSDLLCIVTVHFFVSGIIKNPVIQNVIASVGGLLMCIFGFYYLFKPAERRVPLNPLQREVKGGSFFLKGFVLNIFNPMVLFSWFAVVTIMSVKYNNNDIYIFSYFGALVLTILIIDLLKSYIANKFKSVFTNRLMTRLNKILGVTLVVIGVKFLIEAYMGKIFF